MSGETTVAAIIFIILGALNVMFPYKMAQFKERLDAIGSKRSGSEVEPAEWYVVLTRVLGVLLIGIGLAYTIGTV